MKFENSFEVPLPPNEAWPLLLDVPGIAPCFPGGELTEVTEDGRYKGRVNVRLGPVALTFAGTARLEDVDATARRARVRAQGTDAKGRGAASATAEFALVATPAGTRVTISTDLTLSGAVAQYGRGAGMIQAVAAELVGQFADALRAEIARSRSAPGGAGPQPPEDVPPPQRPIGGIGLGWRLFLRWLRGLFRR
jgi:carbon monoxide dehydrogenase subunit G